MIRISWKFIVFVKICSFVVGASAAQLPTEDEIKGIQKLCEAGGNIQSVTMQAKVDAAIESWKKGSAGVEVEVAKKNLTGALGQVKNDANIAPVYKVYIECVQDSLKQFLNQEKKGSIPHKVSVQMYFQYGSPTVDSKTWTGPGIPVPDLKESIRNQVEIIQGETYWIQPLNQTLASERKCGSGRSLGWSCTIDSSNRLIAYIRNSCQEKPVEGPKVSQGCSSATPLFNPKQAGSLVQCCFFDDSPEAKGFPFNHSYGDWLHLLVAR